MSTSRPHPNLAEHRDGAVAVLRIDRPDALGALSRPIVEALGKYLTRLSTDPDVRVLVVTGTGRGFIAGADITEYHGAEQQRFDSYQRLSRETFAALEHLPQPTIAAVNGFALGGGFELALCCDFIVAVSQASFGLPEIKLGLVPGGGGTQRLSRQLGPRLTKEAVLTGRTMTATELAGHGLLRLVDADDENDDALMTEAMALARRLAAAAPLACRRAKRLIDDGIQRPLAEALTDEQDTLSELFSSADAEEGIAAFVQKRSPVFRGE